MDQQHALSTAAPNTAGRIAFLWQRPWVQASAGAIGWLLIAPLVVKIPDMWGSPFRTTNLVLLVALLLWRRTRWAGIGMGAVIALNFLASTFLATIASPGYLTPLFGTGAYETRWKYHNHYVAGGISPETFTGCVDNAPGDGQDLTLALETWVGGYPEIHIMQADGSDEKSLSERPGHDMHPDWSPDGKQIVFVSSGDGMNLGVMNADGTGRTQLTEGYKVVDMSPSWSPDGRQIAFMTNRSGNMEIYVMNADGSEMRNLTRHPDQDSSPAWSPDGTQIVFTSTRHNPEKPTETGIYVMDADGSNARLITPRDMVGVRPAWSPNGKCIVYQDGAGLDDWIMLVRPDGSAPIKVVHAGAWPNWSRDGRYISYSVIRGEWDFDVYLLDVTTLETKRLTSRPWHDGIVKWKPIR